MVCAEGSEGLIAIPWLRPLSIVWQAVADRDLLCLDGALLVPIEVIETILTFDDRFEELVDIVGGTRGDRKSTRLNSSHVAISYAVFCLQKKIGASLKIRHNEFTSQVPKTLHL